MNFFVDVFLIPASQKRLLVESVNEAKRKLEKMQADHQEAMLKFSRRFDKPTTDS